MIRQEIIANNLIKRKQDIHVYILFSYEYQLLISYLLQSMAQKNQTEQATHSKKHPLIYLRHQHPTELLKRYNNLQSHHNQIKYNTHKEQNSYSSLPHPFAHPAFPDFYYHTFCCNYPPCFYQNNYWNDQRNYFHKFNTVQSVKNQSSSYQEHSYNFQKSNTFGYQTPTKTSKELQNYIQISQSSSDDVKIEFKQEYNDTKIKNKQRLRSIHKKSNQTKNIPKNYGKAMINFILEHSDFIKLRYGSNIHNELVQQLRSRKKKINSIWNLKQLWTNSKYSKQFRILSNLFLRKYSFAHIFNSRVCNHSTHIKYRYKIQEALRYPQKFKNIKEY